MALNPKLLVGSNLNSLLEKLRSLIAYMTTSYVLPSASIIFHSPRRLVEFMFSVAINIENDCSDSEYCRRLDAGAPVDNLLCVSQMQYIPDGEVRAASYPYPLTETITCSTELST